MNPLYLLLAASLVLCGCEPKQTPIQPVDTQWFYNSGVSNGVMTAMNSVMEKLIREQSLTVRFTSEELLSMQNNSIQNAKIK